ncbi:phage tail tape measure protein [Clostridium sp. LBM24168]
MSGLKIGWDASSLNSLKMQLVEQIEKIKQQKIELGVNIKDDAVLKQLNSMLDAIKNVRDTAAKPIDIQVNASKSKEELAGIKGSFEDIINTYKDLGRISVSPIFDKNGMIKSFTVQLQQLNGLIDKVKYNASEFVDGKNSMTPISFNVDNIKEINDLDKTFTKVEDFKNKYNNVVKELQGIKIDSIVEFQRQLNSLNINNFKEKTGEIKNTYDQLLSEQKKYTEGIRQQQQLNNFVNTQQNKLNNVRSGYSGKLDAGSFQYDGLETTYKSLTNELNTYKKAEQSLTAEQSNDIKNRINYFNREKSSIINVTNTIKQQETALNTLRSKFGSIIPDSKINEIKSQMKGLYISSNFKGESNAISQEIEKLKQLASEVQRVKGFGSSIGTFSGAGINMNSSFQDIEKFVQGTVSAKASISFINEGVDSLGNKIKTVNYTINEGSGVISKNKMTIDDNTQGIYKLNTGLQSVDEKNRSFSSGIANSVKSLLGFSAASTAVYGGINQIKSAIQNVVDLDKSQTNIQIITGMNGNQVKGLTQQFSDLASQLHSTIGEMMNGSEEFLRAGKTVDQTKNLLKATTIGATLSGQTNEEVSNQLIAISNGFRMNTDDAKEMTSVIDKLTKADNSSATSFKEISTAMQGSSAMAQSVKVDFNHLLSYISTVSSVTRESASSIGESFNAQFARYQNVKGGEKFDAYGEDLSNVERDLNKYANEHIRSDSGTFKSYEIVLDDLAKKWKNLDEVSKAAISKAMAGVNHANDFQVLMQNYDKVEGMLKDVGNSAGYAEDKFNKIYSKSTQAKIKDLQHAIENLYQSMVNSGTINKALQGLTSFIHTLDTLTTTAPKSGIALAGLVTALVLVIKNASAVSGMFTKAGIILTSFINISSKAGIVTGLADAFSILATSIKGVTLSLLTNPLTWLIAAIGIAGGAIIAHIRKQQQEKEQVDKLKTSYEGLTQAMKDNDNAGIKNSSTDLKKSQDTLQNLIKQKNELQRNSNNPVNTGDPRVDSAISNANTNKLDSVNKKIKEQEKVLKDAGLAFNETTGEIIAYTVAQSRIESNNVISKIEKTSQAEISHKDSIISLGSEYEKLQKISVPNADIQDRMSSIATKLSKEVAGLTTEKDKDGNVTIKNNGLLNAEIGILGKEGVSVNDLKKIKLDAAKSAEQVQVGETAMTYAQAKARMQILQQEANNNKALFSGDAFQKDPFFKKNSDKTADSYKASIDNIQKSLSAVDEIYDDAKKSTDDLDKSNKDFAISEDKASDSTNKATLAVKNATNALKDYQNQIKAVENAIKDYDYSLSTMDEHSNQYIATLEKKKQLLKEELALTQQGVAAGNAQADNLSKLASYEGGSTSTTSTSGGWTGKYSNWINDAGNKTGIDPVLIAAIIQDESSFNPKAHNDSSGATGLGQFLLSTAQEVGLQDRTDPKASIYALASYLRTRINQAGSVKGGIKGYGEGTDAYYNKVMSIYKNFKGGDISSDASGSNEASTYESGYESILSETESLKGNIDNLKQQIDEVVYAQLQAKMGQFDDQIDIEEKKASIAKSNVDLYSEGSQQKVNYLDQEAKAINAQYSAMAKKEEFIQNSIKNGGYNQKVIAELKKDLQEVQDTEVQTIQNLHDVFSSFIDSRLQARITIYNNELDILKAKFDLLDTQDKDNYVDKLDIEKQELIQQEKVKTGIIEQMQYIEQLIAKEKYETTKQLYQSKYDDLNKNLLDVEKTVAEIHNTIEELDLENKLKEFTDKVTDLKNKLSQLNDVTDKGYSEKIDILNNIITNEQQENGIIVQRIKLLQDEASRFADGSTEKINLLDQINDLEQKQSDTQQEIISNEKQLEQQAENQVLNLVENQIYGGKTKQEFEDTIKIRQNAIDAELEAMDKQNQALEEQETRDKNLLDLEESRIKLQQDQNNKNVQQLTQDKNGDWNWTYVADQSVVDQDEKDLRDKQQSNNDWERQTAQQHKQDQLNDEKEQLQQEIQIRQDTLDRIKGNIETAFNDQENLFMNGQTDINTIIQNSLSQMEDLYGVSFGNIVNTVSSSVGSILSEIGKLNPDFVNAQTGMQNMVNPQELTNESHIVYGSGVDLENAKSILGNSGYVYKDISKMSPEDISKLQLTSNDIVVGGEAVTQGLNQGSATRLWGANRDATKEQIAQYGIDKGGTYVVVGSRVDLDNARATFGDKYKYIDIVDMSEEARSGLQLQGGDIVVGGQGATAGLNLNGATRLAGANRQETANAISDYASGEVAKKIKVYATGADYQNAIKTLNSSLYDVIDTASKEVSKIQLNAGDVVVGGGLVSQLQGQIDQTGATAIYGKDRNATLSDLEKFKQQQLSTQKKYDQLTTQQTSTSTTQQTVIIKDAQTKESYAINVGANTNLVTITQNMENINDVAYNGMGQLVLTVNDNVNQAIDSFQKLADAMAAVGMAPDSTSPIQIGNVSTKPYEFATGTDADILKAQFGDTLDVYPGTGFSGRPGTTRYDTNKLYLEDIAKKWGLVPKNSNVDLSKFDTGGYTGDWSEDTGKLAMLHKKEIVLNPSDTENFMLVVDALRNFSIEQSTFSNNIVPFTASDLKGDINNISNENNSTKQEIHNHIGQVVFPGIKSGIDDIINAFTYKLPAKIVKMQ